MEADSTPIWLPDGVRVCCGVSEVQETFVTSLDALLQTQAQQTSAGSAGEYNLIQGARLRVFVNVSPNM